MSQILGSNSYLKITTGTLNYNAAYTVLLHYRLDTAPSADYVAVMSLNNDGEAELSDCDAYQINPFATPDVHRINTRSNSAGTALGGSASVTTTNWYNPVMVRSSATSLRGYLGSATETAIATNDMSARSSATNVVLGAILSSGGATEIAGVTLHSCKIWTAALSSAQLADEIVQVEPVYQSNIYGWYFFDNSADKWNDRSGNGHHFTLIGTSTHTADKPTGVDETIGTGSQIFSVATTGNDTTGDGSLTNPYASITKALTVVTSGGTILVADGTYSEDTAATGYFRPTQIFSSYVTIRSASGTASNVIVRGASNATYNTLIQNNAAYIRFENVTFGMRLSTNGSALRLANSNNIQFVGCKFATQSDSGGTRYGVLLQPSGATVIDSILFDTCTWTQTGTFAARGVSVVWTASNTISNISLTNCTATMQSDCLYLQGGGYTITGGSYTSTDTRAILFGADSNTGGNLTTGSITGATATCTNGHGLLIGNNAGGVTVDDCTCSGGDYGIVIKENTGATVTNCTATGNSSGGAAIYCKAATGASVTYCTENQSVGVGFKVGVGDTGNKCSNITHTHCTVNISGTANALSWGDSTADLGGGVEDYNAYEITGTGNFGSVRATSGITTLAALQAAWTGYDISGNDTNSTFGGSQSSSKTFVFATDAEGLADAGNAASLVFAYVSADGNPSGSIGYTTTLESVTQTEFARRASTGQTWETWGVPTGATVTSVVVAAWNEKTAGVTKLSSHSLKARIINSSGTTIHSAGDLLNATLSITSDTTWQSGTAGSSVAVDSSYQASTTDVRLELEYTVTTSGGGGSAAVDQRFDNIRIDITYTPAPSGTTYDNTVSVAVSGSVSGSGKLTISPNVAIYTGVTTSDGGTLNGINRTTLAATHSVTSASALNGINRLTLAAIEAVTASGKLLLPGSVSLPSTFSLLAASTLNATGTATISATVASSAGTQASFGTSISMPITATTTAASLLNSLASVAVGMLASVGTTAQLSAGATTTLAVTVTLDNSGNAPITLTLTLNAIAGVADSSQLQAVGNALMALVSAAQAASSVVGNGTVTVAATGGTATTATLTGQNTVTLQTSDGMQAVSIVTGQNTVTLQVTDGVQSSAVLTANNTLSIGYTVTVAATGVDGAPITLTMLLPVSASLSPLSIAQMVSATTMAAVTGVTGTASAVFGTSVPVAVAITISENGTLTQTANVTVPVSGEVGTGATLEANSTVMIASAVASIVTSQLDGMSSVDIATVQGVVASGTLSVLNSLSLQLASGMLTSGSVISFTVTTPDGRTVTVQFEARVLEVESEVRVLNVDSENRTFIVNA